MKPNNKTTKQQAIYFNGDRIFGISISFFTWDSIRSNNNDDYDDDECPREAHKDFIDITINKLWLKHVSSDLDCSLIPSIHISQ